MKYCILTRQGFFLVFFVALESKEKDKHAYIETNKPGRVNKMFDRAGPGWLDGLGSAQHPVDPHQSGLFLILVMKNSWWVCKSLVEPLARRPKARR